VIGLWGREKWVKKFWQQVRKKCVVLTEGRQERQLFRVNEQGPEESLDFVNNHYSQILSWMSPELLGANLRSRLKNRRGHPDIRRGEVLRR